MNNPPAFPVHNHGVQTLGLHVTGMSLRDYFAAMVLQGMYARKNFPTGIMIDTAKETYEMADAMLAARENA